MAKARCALLEDLLAKQALEFERLRGDVAGCDRWGPAHTSQRMLSGSILCMVPLDRK